MRRVLFVVFGFSMILEGCNCAGSEFTTRRTFSVHASASDALCQTERSEVNLGQDASFTDAKSFISRIELRKLSVQVTNPKTRDDSVVSKAHGSVQVSSSQTGTTLTLGRTSPSTAPRAASWQNWR
jgi:hypothetical protein